MKENKISNVVQLDVFESRSNRDSGMQKAIDHADAVEPGWSEGAYKFLLKFLDTHRGTFMTEEVRSYAAQMDFPLPASARAWGAVMTKAVKAGIIKRVGYAPVRNANAHRTPATVWRMTTIDEQKKSA